MIPKLQRKWRLPMCLCGVSLSVALLYLCAHKALGQIPPGYGYGGETVEFLDSSYYVAEGNTAVIGVTLNGSTNQTVSVFLRDERWNGASWCGLHAHERDIDLPAGHDHADFQRDDDERSGKYIVRHRQPHLKLAIRCDAREPLDGDIVHN